MKVRGVSDSMGKGDSGTPDVSVVIATKNENGTIATCIQKLWQVFKQNNLTGEVVVADSSHDGTAKIAASLGARVVEPKEKGYGPALLCGFGQANGHCLVMGDGDATYDFLELPRLLAPVQQGEADMVIGSRFKGRIEKGAMPWLHRYIGNPALTWLQNRVFSLNLSDAHSGMRVLTREAYEKMNLKAFNFEFAPHLNSEAARCRLRIKEVPISYHRRATPSKLGTFSHGWNNLRFVLSQLKLRFKK